jgi:membrane protein involved in colicin uptake
MQERGYAPQADNSYSDADIAAVLALPTVKQTEDLRKEQEALAQAAAAEQKALDEKAVADSQADAARKEAAQLQADAEQRQADIKAAAKKLLEDAMPDLRASLIAELKLQPAA